MFPGGFGGSQVLYSDQTGFQEIFGSISETIKGFSGGSNGVTEVFSEQELWCVTGGSRRFQGVFSGISGCFRGLRYRESNALSDGISGGFRMHFRKLQRIFRGLWRCYRGYDGSHVRYLESKVGSETFQEVLKDFQEGPEAFQRRFGGFQMGPCAVQSVLGNCRWISEAFREVQSIFRWIRGRYRNIFINSTAVLLVRQNKYPFVGSLIGNN